VIIELPYLARVSSRAQIAEYYQAGLSMREITKRIGVAKTTVLETLVQDGITRRPKQPCKSSEGSGTISFGYAYPEGKLVINPPEYKAGLEMYRLWRSGQSFRAIARHLNDRKLTTRAGKKWTHEIIKRIVTRHEQQKKGDKHGPR
jgi:transposase-like protein